MKTRIHFVTCHRKSERSFFFRGKQFPVCARCTGFYLGSLSVILFLFHVIYIPLFLSILLIVPALLDGFTQAYCKRESTNLIRVVTGVLAGVGAMSIASIIGQKIGLFIISCY